MILVTKTSDQTRQRGYVCVFYQIVHNRACRPCHPSNSMLLALIFLSKGESMILIAKTSDQTGCVCVCVRARARARACAPTATRSLPTTVVCSVSSFFFFFFFFFGDADVVFSECYAPLLPFPLRIESTLYVFLQDGVFLSLQPWAGFRHHKSLYDNLIHQFNHQSSIKLCCRANNSSYGRTK